MVAISTDFMSGRMCDIMSYILTTYQSTLCHVFVSGGIKGSSIYYFSVDITLKCSSKIEANSQSCLFSSWQQPMVLDHILICIVTKECEMAVGKEENNCVAAAAAAAAAAKPQSEEVFGKKYVWLPQHC